MARIVFLRLVGGEGEAIARRRVPLAEFDIATNPDVQQTLTVLTAARLLTTDRGTVEVAHEALFREWPRLGDWLEEDQESRRVRAHLTEAAHEWDASGRTPSELYRGARLAAILDWSGDHAAEVNELERQFVAESQAVALAEERRQRRANRRLRLLLVGASVGLTLAIAASVVALGQRAAAEQSNTIADQQRGVADQQRAVADQERAAAEQQRAAADAQTVIAEHAADTADAERLGAQGLGAKALDVALLLARQGDSLDDSPATRANLLAALVRSPAAIRISRPLDGRPQAIVGSPDGTTLLVRNNEDQIAVIDAATDATRYVFPFPPGFWAAFLAENDDVIVLTDGPDITLLDPMTDTAVGHITYPEGGDGLGWTPDLKMIGRESKDKRSITIYDAATLRVQRTLRVPTGMVLHDLLMFDDGEVIAPLIPAANADTAWDEPGEIAIATWQPGSATPGSIATVSTSAHLGDAWHGSAVSLDHHTLLLADTPREGQGTLVNLRDGTQLTLKGEHAAPIMGGAFSGDGSLVATSGDDGATLLWNATTGRPRGDPHGPRRTRCGPRRSPIPAGG